MPLENHYQLLGIEPSAPLPTVQSALERLADQANRLAYTSPERSRELWELVRQIRDDLLSGSGRRQAYDASLQPSHASPVATLERPQPAPMLSPGGTPAPPIPPPALVPRVARTSGSIPRGVTLWRLLVAGSIVALALALALALVLNRPGSPAAIRVTTHALPAPTGLISTGFRKGAGFVSEKRVTLRWHPSRRAALYHLQLAAASGAGSDFQHPLLSTLTEGTSRSIKLPGERRYVWRVQALIHGSWSPYAPAVSFVVARPGTSAPHLHTPPASSITTDQVRLCWSPVPWAVAYLLRIQAASTREQITVHGTCQTLTEKPGTYSWSVAGLVRGVQTYAGPFSPPERFTVPAPRTAMLPPDFGVTGACLRRERPVLVRTNFGDVERVGVAVSGIGRDGKFLGFRCDKISSA